MTVSLMLMLNSPSVFQHQKTYAKTPYQPLR